MITAQLQVMVRNLRAEGGHTLSVAQGVNQSRDAEIPACRTQEELWTAFVWPELKLRVHRCWRRQYLYPYHADMPYDCIREAWTSPAGDTADPTGRRSNTASATRTDPAGRHQQRARRPGRSSGTSTDANDLPRLADAEHLGRLRFVGQKTLSRSLADSDVSTLDATAIVLFAAADLLARAKAEDADRSRRRRRNAT